MTTITAAKMTSTETLAHIVANIQIPFIEGNSPATNHAHVREVLAGVQSEVDALTGDDRDSVNALIRCVQPNGGDNYHLCEAIRWISHRATMADRCGCGSNATTRGYDQMNDMNYPLCAPCAEGDDEDGAIMTAGEHSEWGGFDLVY